MKKKNIKSILILILFIVVITFSFALQACKTIEEVDFLVDISEYENGNLVFEKDRYKYQETVKFKIVPNKGYILKSGTLKYNRQDIKDIDLANKTASFKMPKFDVIVYAVFEKISTVKVSVLNSNNGRLDLLTPPEIIPGEKFKVRFTPNKGYKIKKGSIKINGSKTLPDLEVGTNILTVEAERNDMTISAEFVRARKFNIKILDQVNGSILSTQRTAYEQEEVEIRIYPYKGYNLLNNSLKFNNNSIDNYNSKSKNATFVMPSADVTVSANFVEKNKHNAYIGDILNGQIYLSFKNKTFKKAQYYKDETVEVIVVPNSGYRIDESKLLFNKTNFKNNKFVMPDEDVTITAEFVIDDLYFVTINEAENSTATMAREDYSINSLVNIRLTPKNGFKIDENSIQIISNEEEIEYKHIDNLVSFKMPKGDVEVNYSTIIQQKYDLKFVSQENGVGTFNTNQASKGHLVRLTLLPKPGYWINHSPECIQIDGLSLNDIGISDNYIEFKMPDHEIKATLKFIPLSSNKHSINIQKTTNYILTSDVIEASEGEIVHLTHGDTTKYNIKKGTLKVNGIAIENDRFRALNTEMHITYDVIKANNYNSIEIFNNITVESYKEGIIKISKNRAKFGESYTIEIIPNLGYTIDLNGVSVNSNIINTDRNTLNYTYFMSDSDQNITVKFVPAEAYAVDIEANLGGTIKTNGKLFYSGGKIYPTITPNKGYYIDYNTLRFNDKLLQSDEKGYYFLMENKNSILTGYFKELPLHDIAVSEITNGRITSTKTKSYNGDRVALIIYPDNGYKLLPGSIKSNNVHYSDEYFIMTNTQAIITAQFVPLEYDDSLKTVNIKEAIGGKILVNNNTFKQGEIAYFTIVPDFGYKFTIGSFKINTKVIQTSNKIDKIYAEYTISNSNLEVEGLFEKADLKKIEFGDIQNGNLSLLSNKTSVGQEIEILAVPNNNYYADEDNFRVNGNLVHIKKKLSDKHKGSIYITFKALDENMTITLPFKKLDQIRLSIKKSPNVLSWYSNLTDSKTSNVYHSGEYIRIYFYPTHNYALKHVSLKINDEIKELTTDKNYIDYKLVNGRIDISVAVSLINK